jgi:hypothetical protein
MSNNHNNIILPIATLSCAHRSLQNVKDVVVNGVETFSEAPTNSIDGETVLATNKLSCPKLSGTFKENENQRSYLMSNDHNNIILPIATLSCAYQSLQNVKDVVVNGVKTFSEAPTNSLDGKTVLATNKLSCPKLSGTFKVNENQRSYLMSNNHNNIILPIATLSCAHQSLQDVKDVVVNGVETFSEAPTNSIDGKTVLATNMLSCPKLSGTFKENENQRSYLMSNNHNNIILPTATLSCAHQSLQPECIRVRTIVLQA